MSGPNQKVNSSFFCHESQGPSANTPDQWWVYVAEMNGCDEERPAFRDIFSSVNKYSAKNREDEVSYKSGYEPVPRSAAGLFHRLISGR